ncbi:hypothetical protein AMP2_gp053 [Pseudomonas phage vB_Pae_AM.P2]|uniref:Uncharacterized protein n=1 Tax=Pseudomonas phage vB_Pae_AM.P2 TaxID=2731695 RepID=A0A7S6B685_9CAUD|nr:hypothetical protein AMP2_gp053 [Pseudomonas phage vB_Pae_AM.P2]
MQQSDRFEINKEYKPGVCKSLYYTMLSDKYIKEHQFVQHFDTLVYYRNLIDSLKASGMRDLEWGLLLDLAIDHAVKR